MFDLHLHSSASDGDLPAAEVVHEAARRGLTGISVTDHNGLWGADEAARAAKELGIECIEGIEITARYHETDVHILGYARKFMREVLTKGLAATRAGYEQRIQEMVRRCQAGGYEKVSWEHIQARRADFDNPCFVSFDVARELIDEYSLDPETARKLTVSGGACHVPYGDWALSPSAAVELVHLAGGKASLAHPGTIEHESSQEILLTVLQELMAAGLDALEAVHPFHDDEYQNWLRQLSEEHHLAITGGSDWHGPSRLFENDAVFGKIGVSALPFL